MDRNRVQFAGKDGTERPKQPRFRTEGRYFVEALTVLAVAVAMFRAFAVEGFMISTGSMAPGVWGYHYAIECPDCHYSFAYTATEGLEEPVGESTPAEQTIRCPNCLYEHISLRDRPVVEGDQILVDKNAFSWNRPQRWNPVVFRNPKHPKQTFLKRMIGLSGETIEIRDGDIYVNDMIQRKGLGVQRDMRVLLEDSRYQPQLQDPNYYSSWQIVDQTAESRWTKTENGFRSSAAAEANAADSSTPSWIQFRRWVRSGGSARYSVKLENWPIDLPLPNEDAVLRYDPIPKQMSCRGALDRESVDKILSLTTDPVFTQKLEELFTKSHIRPIQDSLAYNSSLDFLPEPVRDLMLATNLRCEVLQSDLVLVWDDGWFKFLFEFDFEDRTVQLKLANQDKTLRKGMLPEVSFERPPLIEIVVADRQVLVAVDGVLVFEPYAYRVEAGKRRQVLEPIRIGNRVGQIELSDLRVYRDLHYRNVVNGPRKFILKENELLLLGDNTEVSVDGRHWPAGSIHESDLVGRPFVLHLPSRKQSLQIGSFSTSIRVPDFDRIRWLR